jgi:peptidoglycan/xylan/chitin deacetylase (PgdA/CDA1 family)
MAILAFHNISEDFPLGLNLYPPHRLKNLLHILIEEGYNFSSLTDYVRHEEDARKISITFDDGYESFYYGAFPILQEMSIPSSVFVPFQFVGKTNRWDYTSFFRKTRHMSEAQIKEISESGVEIGSHGLTHSCLAGMSPRLLRIELERSKKGLENLTGVSTQFISYPFGMFDEKVERFALEAGYARGFSLSYLKKSCLGYTLPRWGIYSIDTPYAIALKLGGGPITALEKAKSAILNSYSAGTIFLNKLRPGRFKEIY